jgi:hypothetical protein
VVLGTLLVLGTVLVIGTLLVLGTVLVIGTLLVLGLGWYRALWRWWFVGDDLLVGWSNETRGPVRTWSTGPQEQKRLYEPSYCTSHGTFDRQVIVVDC